MVTILVHILIIFFMYVGLLFDIIYVCIGYVQNCKTVDWEIKQKI